MLDSRNILKLELRGFADIMDVRYKREELRIAPRYLVYSTERTTDLVEGKHKFVLGTVIFENR